MAFYGCYFSFDGISCEEYGLMLYDFGTASTQNTSTLVPEIEIIEDRSARRFTPISYGTVLNKPLTFNMTFGANKHSATIGRDLDRWDADAVAGWLTGHQTYKWLEIFQPDMETFRYRCIIQNLNQVSIGNMQWGFTCTVVCDSPFAYTDEERTKIVSSGYKEIEFFNRSTYNGLYKPKMEISITRGGEFSIENVTDGGRITEFTGMPTTAKLLIIDNENEIITCPTVSNPYQYFNFKFLRLRRGMNTLKINGVGTLELICSFPVSIGG